MNRSLRAWFAGFMAVICMGAFTLNAQIAARLNGSVFDASGATVPNATVDLILAGGSKSLYTTTTTPEGLFSLTGIPAGSYTLTITAAGFKKFSQSIELTPGIETSLPGLKLQVGATAETVEVKADTETVQSTNAEVAVNLSNKQVSNLPSLNRSPQGFIQTQAGVSNGRNGVSIFNGQRTSFTNVTLDGINIQDNFIRTNAADFSPNLLLLDQVAEMTVSTSNTNPSAGGGASQVIFISPSGTNSFHGNVFWSNRNNAFAAQTWFNNRDKIAKPFLNQNQTGITVGGPIKRDKLFFYTNYEAFRLRQQAAQNRTILSTLAAQGIFQYKVNGTIQQVDLLKATGGVISPTMAAIIKQIPDGTQINNNRVGDGLNTGGYSFNQRSNRDRNNVTGKLDYNLSPKNTITGTFLYNTDLLDRPDVTATSFSLVPKVANDDIVTASSAGWRYSPTGTLTNEVRAGFNRAPALFISSETFPTAIINPTIFSNPLNTFRSQGRYTNTYNVNDNASKVWGKHTFQFGYQLQRTFVAPYNDAGITPTYTVSLGSGNTGIPASALPGIGATDNQNANDLYSALVGNVSAYTQTFNALTQTSGFVNGATNIRHWQQDNHAVYFTDTWKLYPRLTLNLGLRYEYFTPMTEENGVALLPQLVSNNPVATLYSNATLNFAGSGTNRSFYNPDRNNFGPNIGLAWDPTGSGRTAIRMGYSVNYVNDENIAALASSVGNNTGLAQTVSASNTKATVASLPAIATPAFTVPRTLSQNFALSTTTALGLPDPNLRTPYVEQWNVGVQHQLKSFIFDVRYVGNHGVKLFRGVDLNQVNFNANGFLADFLRAQSNANLPGANGNPAYNASIPGSQVLTVFPLLPQQGNLVNATNRNLIATGQVADLARVYMNTGTSAINFFPNPNAQTLWLLTNYSNSTYNALQFDVRSNSFHGLTVQGNYTYSRLLTDATSGSDNNFQNRNEPLLDNNNPKLEKSRATFDLTHAIKANFVYEIPMGTGHRFNYKGLGRVLSGWQMSGVLTRQSGVPFSILSGYGTFIRGVSPAGTANPSQNNTVNTQLTQDQLNSIMGLRFAGNGPYFINASAIGTDGRAIAPTGSAPFNGQVFFTPPAGTVGTLSRRAFSGPWFTNLDFGAQKITRIREKQSMILRFDSTNFFNHPAFSNPGDQTVTATSFGQIAATQNGRRVFQFTAQYKF